MTIKALLASAVAAAVIAVAPAAKAQEYQWKMATAVAENSYFYNAFILRFVDYAKTLTNGRVEITPYGAGVITPAFKVYDAVSDGLVELGHSSPGYLLNLDPANGLLAAFPGGMTGDTMMHWLYYGGGKELWEEFRADEMALHPLIVGLHGSEIFLHSRKPIRVADDLKGLKIRTGGPNGEVVRDYFGGIPVAAAQPEIYGLLERGAIDAAEFATPGPNAAGGYNEIARYVIVPGIHTPSSPWELVMKQERWDALPDDIKSELEMAAKLTTLDSYMQTGVDDLAAMDAFRKNKNEIVELDPALIEAYREAGRDWARKKAEAQSGKGNDWMEKILTSYVDFQERWIDDSVYRVEDR